MDKTFLQENLWNIFQVAKEERTDGDNFVGDMSTAPNLFLNGLKPEGKQYQCMAELDKPALLAQWEAVEDKGAEFDTYHAIVEDRYKALCAAHVAEDREAFEEVVADALEADGDAQEAE